MARKTVVPRPKRCVWKPPAFEEIRVSAEAPPVRFWILT